MKKLLLTLMLTVVSSGIALNTGISLASAQEDNSLYGTHSVSFEPKQIGGELQRCMLMYVASQVDYVYLGGNPIAIVGHIGVDGTGSRLGLMMKVGVKNMEGKHPMVRPNFAYLQTKSYSTVKVRQEAFDGEEGYRMFVYPLLDPSVKGLFKEMMASRKITVGFNRKKGGMDVLVPIDLEVIDVELVGNRPVRILSEETMINFGECTVKLMEQMEHNLEKKKEQ